MTDMQVDARVPRVSNPSSDPASITPEGKSLKRIQAGMRLKGIIVETCRDPGIGRIRVRPLPGQEISPDMRVEFPKDLREGVPVGTRYEVDGVVSLKHWKDGRPKGSEYFVARQSAKRLPPQSENP